LGFNPLFIREIHQPIPPSSFSKRGLQWFQSLIHQGNSSTPIVSRHHCCGQVKVSIPYSSGKFINTSPGQNERRTQWQRVSIPYSSGKFINQTILLKGVQNV